MRTLKIIGWVSGGLLILIQLIPVRRDNPPANANAQAPANVQRILAASCYDCHSHDTRWPWYSYVAPLSWLIASDVRNARERLNFSQWDQYPVEAQTYLKNLIVKEVSGNDMPPLPYVLLHPHSRVSPESLGILKEWNKASTKP
jgi:hypothetical protein